MLQKYEGKVLSKEDVIELEKEIYDRLDQILLRSGFILNGFLKDDYAQHSYLRIIKHLRDTQDYLMSYVENQNWDNTP